MDDFTFVNLANGWTVGRFTALEAARGVSHFITTRQALDVSAIHADRRASADAIAAAMGVRRVAFLKQVHGNEIVERCAAAAEAVPHADGMITDAAGLGLMVVSADCVLVLAADLDGRAIGAAHASWRGTVKRIALAMIGRMARRYSIDPDRIVACVGPSAGPERYEVGPDVVEAAMAGLGPGAARFLARREGKTYFDLWAANRAQLLEAGLSEKNVHVAGVCTITRNDMFPSYRAEGERAGRFAAVIAKTPR
jgi:polyphenol oxidase